MGFAIRWATSPDALDALVDYGVVPDSPERDVPNPRRIALTTARQQARAAFDHLTAECGAEAFLNAEHARPTMRGFKIAHRPLPVVCETPSRA